MFGRLFGGKKKPAPAPVSAALSTAVESSILNVLGSKSIPPMPGAAQKAFQLATDPTAEARDFIEVIESDEALSARVIKIANSVFFDRGKPSTTIEESVLVIGINELRCLLNATTLSEIFPSRHPARNQLWANDIATALIARTIAQRFAPGKEDIAFLGGLMHDIGKLLLLQKRGEDYTKILTNVEQEGISFCEAEARLFAFDHTEVGQLIGERWNFTAELKEMIRRHHRSWDGGDTTPTLSRIVQSADVMAHALGLGHSRAMFKFRSRCEEELQEVWKILALSEEERKEFLSRCQRVFETEYDLYTAK